MLSEFAVHFDVFHVYDGCCFFGLGVGFGCFVVSLSLLFRSPFYVIFVLLFFALHRVSTRWYLVGPPETGAVSFLISSQCEHQNYRPNSLFGVAEGLDDVDFFQILFLWAPPPSSLVLVH